MPLLTEQYSLPWFIEQVDMKTTEWRFLTKRYINGNANCDDSNQRHKLSGFSRSMVRFRPCSASLVITSKLPPIGYYEIERLPPGLRSRVPAKRYGQRPHSARDSLT